MSIALNHRIKALEKVVQALEARLLLLEMQKQPVEPVPEKRETLTLRRKVA